MSDWSTASLLAIEASSPTLRLALAFGGDRLVHSETETEQSLGQMIIRRIDTLCQSAGLGPAQCDGIVVGTGPGSFTGLRIAISAAKGIAVARKIPIVGVSIFEIAAVSLRHEREPIDLCTSVRKGELLVTQYDNGKLDINNVRAMSIAEFAAIGGTKPFACIHCSSSCDCGDSSRRNLSASLQITASILLRLGREKLERGEIPDIASLEPLYIQLSQAEINHGRRSL
ncbi:MAG: tRNA (adenosine(37)-N6)-threonylcarbamoyltransferase complex dimerization subunit type 1 TsaB [Candidatus Zixiibacteriota bacterium]